MTAVQALRWPCLRCSSSTEYHAPTRQFACPRCGDTWRGADYLDVLSRADAELARRARVATKGAA